jgi:hypothetical protein
VQLNPETPMVPVGEAMAKQVTSAAQRFFIQAAALVAPVLVFESLVAWAVAEQVLDVTAPKLQQVQMEIQEVLTLEAAAVAVVVLRLTVQVAQVAQELSVLDT